MKRDNAYKLVIILALIIILGAIGGSFAFGVQANFTSSAQSVTVMERSSGRVLYEKNSAARLPMASTTKIVTALTVIKHCNLDDVVEIPRQAVGVEGSSIYLREGEHLTVRELLYGLMLRSGNDTAVALALHASGSVEAFAELMNDTAREVGCVNSHFVNPHGLHDDDHYTTAYDLALVTCKALENPEFRQIVSTKTIRIHNEGYEYDRVLINKNKLLSNYADADGVKTGYTKKAGRCFVGSATRNGMQVVAVVLNCGPMFEDTASLLDAAFAFYEYKTVIPSGKICGSVNRKGERVYYSCPVGFSYPVRDGERLATEIDLTDELQEIRVLLNGEKVFSRKLVEVAK